VRTSPCNESSVELFWYFETETTAFGVVTYLNRAAAAAAAATAAAATVERLVAEAQWLITDI